jgi:hypothetical protein
MGQRSRHEHGGLRRSPTFDGLRRLRLRRSAGHALGGRGREFRTILRGEPGLLAEEQEGLPVSKLVPASRRPLSDHAPGRRRGQARIDVRAKGNKLTMPALPLTAPVVVELRKLDGSPPCWGAEHSTVEKNTARHFVARGD